MTEDQKVEAFKGFNSDMTCRDFQYEEGQTFTHEGKVEECFSGFHAVTKPLDALRYYPPSIKGGAAYHKVTVEGVAPPWSPSTDSKIAGSKIKAGVKYWLRDGEVVSYG